MTCATRKCWLHVMGPPGPGVGFGVNCWPRSARQTRAALAHFRPQPDLAAIPLCSSSGQHARVQRPPASQAPLTGAHCVSAGRARRDRRRPQTHAAAGLTLFAPDCRWRAKAERERMLTRVAQDPERALRAVEQAEGLLEHEPVAEAHGLLHELMGQDFEVDDDGVPRLYRGTRQGRIISTVDPEMRHGRKSESRRFDGFELHAAVTNSDEPVITAVEVGDASAHDRAEAKAADRTPHRPARQPLRRAPEPIHRQRQRTKPPGPQPWPTSTRSAIASPHRPHNTPLWGLRPPINRSPRHPPRSYAAAATPDRSGVRPAPPRPRKRLLQESPRLIPSSLT